MRVPPPNQPVDALADQARKANFLGESIGIIIVDESSATDAVQ